LADLQRTVYPHSGHPSAAGRAQDRVSSPAKDRRSASCATQPTNFLSFIRSTVVDAGLSEDADIDDEVGTFVATPLFTPSDIVYSLEGPVMVTRKDNSLHAVPADMFRLESTSAGAVIYVNKLDSAYNLQDAVKFDFRVAAVDRAQKNISAVAVVEVMFCDDDDDDDDSAFQWHFCRGTEV